MGFYATASEDRAGKSASHPLKNRVWDFLSCSDTRAGFFVTQALEPHRNNQPTPTTTASGMRYYGYRYYSPTLSRFVNRDPIGEAAGPGLYTFVGNSPLDRIDHLGLCGVTLRRYVGRAGHQWIHYGTTNNVGFYPPGQWVDENELCRRIPNRPDPDNPDNYYEWETVQSDKGKLPDGTPCKCATCDQIEACLRSQTTGDPDPPGFSGLFGNCRKRSGQAIGSCCLKRGKMTHKPPSGQGAPSRCTGDSVGGSSWICGS